MAQNDGERRMLFDTRGKRKNVIRVVYAVLALLMGASLFLVVGPFNLAELVGGSSGGDAAKVFEEQAERAERRLAKNPRDEGDLLVLARARVNAANAQLSGGDPEAAVRTISFSTQREYDAALEAWQRYLKVAGDEASPTTASLFAGSFFGLAEQGSTTLADVQENVAVAARAQRIAAERRPSLGSLSTLAIYEYFDGNVKAAERATAEAVAKATSKAEEEAIEKQLAEYRKNAAQFQKGLKQAEKQEQQSGRETLQNPFGFGIGAGQ